MFNAGTKRLVPSQGLAALVEGGCSNLSYHGGQAKFGSE